LRSTLLRRTRRAHKRLILAKNEAPGLAFGLPLSTHRECRKFDRAAETPQPDADKTDDADGAKDDDQQADRYPSRFFFGELIATSLSRERKRSGLFL